MSCSPYISFNNVLKNHSDLCCGYSKVDFIEGEFVATIPYAIFNTNLSLDKVNLKTMQFVGNFLINLFQIAKSIISEINHPLSDRGVFELDKRAQL